MPCLKPFDFSSGVKAVNPWLPTLLFKPVGGESGVRPLSMMCAMISLVWGKS